MPKKEEKILEKPEVDLEGSASQADDLEGQLPDPVEKEDKTVSYETYKKTINVLKGVKGKLTKLNKEIETATDKNLIEQNKFEDLFNKEKIKTAEKDEVLKLKETKILMQGAGMKDMDYAVVVIKKLDFNEDLEAVNAEGIFIELKEKKPYLFGETTPNVPNTDSSKTNILQKGKVFTKEEIGKMTSEQYKKNEELIMEQMGKGLIK